MGIIAYQTSRNIIYTFLGILIGGCNITFLYPHILPQTDYGLIVFILAGANLLMPILTFGLQNTLIKYFPLYKQHKDKPKWLFLIFFMPLFLFLTLLILMFFFEKSILDFLNILSIKNGKYLWFILLLAFFYTYFELFYAWSRVHLRSIYGNLLREIFHRVMVSVLLFLVYIGILEAQYFIPIVIVVFGLRMGLMGIACFRTQMPKIKIGIPLNAKPLFMYSTLMVFTGLVANILMSIDKIVLGKYVSIDQVAVYGVAVFIATTTQIPPKSMHNIVYPITTNLLYKLDFKNLSILYKKTSTTLLIISGFIFALILTNISDFYLLLPHSYVSGIFVVWVMSFANLINSIIGNNNAIFFSSNNFKYIFIVVCFFCLYICVVAFVFTKYWGLEGLVFGLLMSYLSYHAVKVYAVYKMYHIHPFSYNLLKIGLLIAGFVAIFCSLNLSYPPVVNIAIKSGCFVISYTLIMVKMKFSTDLNHKIAQILNPFPFLRRLMDKYH